RFLRQKSPSGPRGPERDNARHPMSPSRGRRSALGTGVCSPETLLLLLDWLLLTHRLAKELRPASSSQHGANRNFFRCNQNSSLAGRAEGWRLLLRAFV